MLFDPSAPWVWFIYNCLGKKYKCGWSVLVEEWSKGMSRLCISTWICCIRSKHLFITAAAISHIVVVSRLCLISYSLNYQTRGLPPAFWLPQCNLKDNPLPKKITQKYVFATLAANWNPLWKNLPNLFPGFSFIKWAAGTPGLFNKPSLTPNMAFV